MRTDPRDEIWNAAFRTHYLAAYNEAVAERLVARWQSLDDLTKVIVALTASGSAIAGWSLWSIPRYKFVWLAIAGLGAVLSIVHTSLDVPSRLTLWGDLRKSLALLRLDLETFQMMMRVNPDFDVGEFTGQLVEYRKRFGEADQRIRPDILLTKRFKYKCQKQLDEQLGVQDDDRESDPKGGAASSSRPVPPAAAETQVAGAPPSTDPIPPAAAQTGPLSSIDRRL